MESNKISQKELKQFFTHLAYDNSISWEALQALAEEGKELVFGDFMQNYSHNNPDDFSNELSIRMNKYFPNLPLPERTIYLQAFQSFCNLFEGSYSYCSFSVLGEIKYFSSEMVLIEGSEKSF